MSSYAQQLTGSLVGIVTDSSGAAVPKATVVLKNDNSGDVRRTETNGEGYYSIQGVFAGQYTLTIEAKGFSVTKIERVNFNSGDKRSQSVELQVASTGTTVEVVSQLADLTPVDTGERQIILTKEQLENTPIVGRSAAEFIKILPGFAPISGVENRPGFNGENIGINGNGDGGKQSAIGNFSANGTRAAALDITADGAHVSDPGCNCASPVNPNQEFIAEFRVQTSNFGAENSKGPVVISSITKSGGRDFHGSAYLAARHFSLNSNDAILNKNGVKRPENKYFFPGGTFSGPVVIPGTNFNKNRDKLFFFTGFEAYRQTIDTGLLRAIVATPEMRAGDFTNTAYLNAINTAGGGNAGALNSQFPGGRIPASQIDPGMRRLLALTPTPNSDPNQTQGFNWVNALVLTQNMYQSANKVDYNISDNTKLFVRYNRQSEVQPFPIQLWWRNGGAVPLPTPTLGKNKSDSISGNLTKVLSPSTTNEFVFGYTFVDFPNEYEDYSKMTKTTNQYPYRGLFTDDDKIPGFLSWAGPFSSMWLPGGFDPVLFATKHLVTATNNFSKVAGTHTMKFGGYYGSIVNKQPGNDPSAGAIFFTPWHGETSGNILADMVAGRIESFQQTTRQAVRNMGWSEVAFYAQDNWKLSKRITIEYGLRAQHLQPWKARNGVGIAVFNPAEYSPNAPSASLPGISWFAKNKDIPLTGWKSRALFWSPRVGFAWDIFGNTNTVLRGGFGRFVYHDAQLASGSMDLPAGVRGTTVFPESRRLADVDRISTQGTLAFNGEVVDLNDDRQPVTNTYSVTISQRLPGKFLLDAAYVGSNSNSLINAGLARNINLVPNGAMLSNPTGDPNTFRPRRQYGNLNQYSHSFYSNYNSLQTSIARNGKLLSVNANYTWSKALGIVDNISDAFNLRNNYGVLGFDRTHIFNFTHVFNMPAIVPKDGNAFAKGLVNGWQLSGIISSVSGANLQQNIGGGNFSIRANNANGDSISNFRIAGTDGIQVQPRLTCDPRQGLGKNQFVNGSCFAPPIEGANGRAGQNGASLFPLLRGPGFFNWDMGLGKTFQVTERQRLVFRLQSNNWMNRPNLSFVGGDPSLNLFFDNAGKLDTKNFGVAENKVGRRIMILSLKYEF
jgi:hypothetical protein